MVEYVEHENYVVARGWTVSDEDIAPFDSLMRYTLLASGDPYGEDAPWVLITFHCLGEGSSTIEVSGWVSDTLRDQDKTFPDSVEIPVNQVPPAPVGGVLMPVNKLNVITPYLALAGLVAVVSTVIVARKRH